MGEVKLKEQLGTSIAGMVQADYRMDSHRELICCSVDGEGIFPFGMAKRTNERKEPGKLSVRGYLPPTQGGTIVQTDPTQDILHELGMRKQNLLMELNNYEENRRIAESQGRHPNRAD